MSVFLCVKMDVNCGESEFDKATKEAFPQEGVQRMLQLPALQWKIWCVDPERKQAGGFYLFAAREAAEGYAKQAVLALQQRPGISNVTTQIWTINEENTRMTKGPIDLPQIKDL